MFVEKNTIVVVSGATVAGTTEVDSSIVDMQGFDGVVFIVVLGAITANGVVTLNAEDNSSNATGGMTAITGAQTIYTDSGAGTAAGNAIVLDVYRPQQRFVRAQLLRTVANAVVDSIIAIKYRFVKPPAPIDATVIEQVKCAATA